jgi:hypothetical protein
MQSTGKKVYSKPELTVHGAVEEITKACDKEYGNGDGYTFQSQQIVCGS